MTFAYCLCSSDVKSKCKGKLTEGGMHHITVLVILKKSPLISDIELSLFSCSWKEIQRKERELEANIKRPAEADKYKTETLAEANKNRVILEAEAEAEAIRVKGEAEAFAIEAKAKAEAEQMAKKADAWKEYREAAVVDMVLETMPKIAAEVAAPLSQCKKIVMVSNGQSDVGASKITAEILDIVSNLPKSVEALTGIDISKSMRLSNRV